MAMKTSSYVTCRSLLLASAIGIAGSLAADEKKIIPPRAEPVLHNDSKVYMIVEDPRFLPQEETKVIEIIPNGPPAEKRSTKGSSSARKSRSTTPERGETLYLEDPAQQVIIVDPTPTPTFKATEETAAAKQESTSTRKTETKQRSSAPKSITEDTKPTSSRKTETTQRASAPKISTEETNREVQKLQEKVNKLEGELDRAQAKSTTPQPPTTTTEVQTAKQSEPKLTPFSATEERLPVVSTNPPAETSQTIVSDKMVTTTQKTPEDRSPAPLAKIEPPPPEPSKDPLDTTPTSPIVSEEKKPSPPPASEKPDREDAPVAKKTDKPGLVTSPYPPHRVIDVRGMASGTLAKDPSTQEIFRVP
jgi:hypothetical protein